MHGISFGPFSLLACWALIPPFSPHCRHYRKVLLATMPTLNYLDDMPVFPKDRRLAVAFAAGGMEAERRCSASAGLNF